MTTRRIAIKATGAGALLMGGACLLAFATQPSPARRLTVYATGDTWGEVEPCG